MIVSLTKVTSYSVVLFYCFSCNYFILIECLLMRSPQMNSNITELLLIRILFSYSSWSVGFFSMLSGNFCALFLTPAILLPNFELSHELISFYTSTHEILFISIISCRGSSTSPVNFFFHSLIALIYWFFRSSHWIFLIFCLLLIFIFPFVSRFYPNLFMIASV